MTEVQELQLNLLIQLDMICHKHNLRYYLAFGTCIGAMHHQGFIPWDHEDQLGMQFIRFYDPASLYSTAPKADDVTSFEAFSERLICG